MKRLEIIRWTEFGFVPRFRIGIFDQRRKKRTWKWIAVGWGYWAIQFNYGFVAYGEDQ